MLFEEEEEEVFEDFLFLSSESDDEKPDDPFKTLLYESKKTFCLVAELMSSKFVSIILFFWLAEKATL